MKRAWRFPWLALLFLATLLGQTLRAEQPAAGRADAGSAGVRFVFVTPDSGSGVAIDGLANLPPVKVRGGRALPFRVLRKGEDPRAAAVEAALTTSPAVRQVLAWWDAARRVAPAPCQKWIGAAGPVPIWVAGPGIGKKGPGLFSLVPCKIRQERGEVESSQILVIEDLKLPDGTLVSVEEMIAAGLLIPVVCHESGHGIMADLYRERFLAFSLLGSGFGGGHDSPVETDPHLAFREGFAEAIELVLARRFPREFYAPVPATVRPAVAGFARAMGKNRVRLAGLNRFIFAANGRVKDGQLKPGLTDAATEGVIAALLETLINHANWRDGLAPVFRVLSRRAPPTFFALVDGLLAEFPGDAATIRRILLEYTCYTIQSPEAARRYEQYYLARKAFVQGKLGREDFSQARAAWQTWKDEQRRRIESGAPLCAAAPEPLVVSARNGFALDLNDADPDRLTWHLEAFLPPAAPEQIKKQAAALAGPILARRRELGAFSSLESLRGAMPVWLFSRLEAGRRRQESRLQAQIDDLVSLRRSLEKF